MASLHDPAEPDFGRFMDPATFGARFGSTDDQLARVESWLRSGHLTITHRYPQRTAVGARGTVLAIEDLFRIQLHDFIDSDGYRFHAATGRPLIPPHLRSVVMGLTGLDTSLRARPLSLTANALLDIPRDGLGPRDAATAFNITPLHDQGFHGENQAVAIVSFDSFRQEDVAGYDRMFGLDGPDVERVPVLGGTTIGKGRVEVALDIDIIRAIAPQAQILSYEAPNHLANFPTVIDQIVEDGRADIVSVSWGVCEEKLAAAISRLPGLETLRDEMNQSLQAAVAKGITVFAASGDSGAYGCQHGDPSNVALSSVWPGDLPLVVSVGGTLISVREDGTYFEEAAWEDVLSGGATGGGLNPVEARPDWQTGPGVGNEFSNGMRQFPDVAGPADPDSGWMIFVDGKRRSRGGNGTSAAAPFWAGVMVLIGQFAASVGIEGLGYVNPTLYAIASSPAGAEVFHDVTRGGNRFHNAGPGWDFATGWGSPNVAALAQAVVDHLR